MKKVLSIACLSVLSLAGGVATADVTNSPSSLVQSCELDVNNKTQADINACVSNYYSGVEYSKLLESRTVLVDKMASLLSFSDKLNTKKPQLEFDSYKGGRLSFHRPPDWSYLDNEKLISALSADRKVLIGLNAEICLRQVDELGKVGFDRCMANL